MDSEVFQRYLKYLEETKLSWHLYNYAPTKSDLFAAFKAVQRSRLEKLCMYLKDDLLNDTENLAAMENALAHHPTLRIVKIYAPSAEQFCWCLTLLISLATIKQLTQLTIHEDTSLDAEEFVRLLRVLQSNKQLKKLRFKYTLESGQMSILLDELKDLPDLEVISLGSLEQIEKEVLLLIGEFLAERPHIKYDFRNNYDYEAQDIIKSCFDSSVSTKHVTQLSAENNHPANISLPNLEIPFVELLPMDLIKAILFQLNVRHLIYFTMTNKRARELCMREEFWREYYLQHFDTIPDEVLEVISLLHGEVLLQANSLQQVSVTWNIWLAALRHMPQLYMGPTYSSFPDFKSTGLRSVIEQKYPQFIGSHLGATHDRDKDALDTIWFMKQLDNNDGYLKIGFHLNRSGIYSGILLKGDYFQGHTSTTKVWELIQHIFDWQTATSAKELVDKCEDMIEAFILSHYRHSWNDKYTMYFNKISLSAIKTFSAFDSVQDQIRTVIDTTSDQICTGLAQRDYAKLSDMIENKMDQLQARSKNINNGFNYKQKLMKRSELHQKYWWGDKWMNFHTSSWDTSIGVKQNSVLVERPHRPSKAIPKVLLVRFIRTTLNFIMMPLLITFWPQDLLDEDSNHYVHFIDHQFQQLYRKRYCKNFTRLEDLSVSSAAPHCWPVIALAVAKLVIGDICDVVQSFISARMTDNQPVTETKMSDLINSLTRFNLFSPAHLKDIRELFS